MNMLDSNFLLEKTTLERIQVMVQKKVDHHCIYGLRGMEVGAFMDHLTGDVAFQFRAFVYGELQKPIELAEQPTSWWQMFKRDVMPRWFIRKFPVRSSKKIIDVKTIYPDLKVSLPPDMSRVVVLIQPRP